MAGGVLVVANAGLQVGASVPFSDTAGTLTLQNVDALDATTESTVEAAIDTLANLTSVQGHTLTLTGALIRSGAHSLTLTTTGATDVTLPTTGTLATLAGSEALTNKTLNGLTVTSSNGTLTIVNGSTLVTSGANSITLTSTGATNVTLPTTGTLATLAGSEALTNKSLNGMTVTDSTGTFTLTNAKTFAVTNTLTLSGTDSTTMTFPTTTATIARTDAGQTFTGVQTMTSPALTTANFTGEQTLAENASVALDPALSADGKWSGTTITGTAGTALVFGDIVYLAAADSRWELIDADASATAGPVRLGIVVLAAAGDGSSTTILTYGTIRADANFPTFTISAPVYLSTTTGDLQTTAPSGTDDVIRIVGHANTADELFWNPSNDWLTAI